MGAGGVLAALIAVAADAGGFWAGVEAGTAAEVGARCAAAGAALGYAAWLRTRAVARRFRAFIAPGMPRGPIGVLLGEDEYDDAEEAAEVGGSARNSAQPSSAQPKGAALPGAVSGAPGLVRFDSFDEFPGFPFRTYSDLVRRSADVKILGTYLYQLLDPEDCRRFLGALTEAANASACIKIMMLCPDSKAASQRARELRVAPAAMKEEMERNLSILYRWRNELPEKIRGHVDIRLYPDRPPPQGPLYVCDDVALVSSLSLGHPSQDSPHLRYPTLHPHMRPLLDFFVQVWAHAVPLDDHMRPILRLEDARGTTLQSARIIEDRGVSHVAVRSRTDRHAMTNSEYVQVLHAGRARRFRIEQQVVDPIRLAVLDDKLHQRDGDPQDSADWHIVKEARSE